MTYRPIFLWCQSNKSLERTVEIGDIAESAFVINLSHGGIAVLQSALDHEDAIAQKILHDGRSRAVLKQGAEAGAVHPDIISKLPDGDLSLEIAMQKGNDLVDCHRLSVCQKTTKLPFAVRLPDEHEQAQERYQSLTVILLCHAKHNVAHIPVGVLGQDNRFFQAAEPKRHRSHLIQLIGELRKQGGRKRDCNVLYHAVGTIGRRVEIPLMRHLGHNEHDLALAEPFRTVANGGPLQLFYKDTDSVEEKIESIARKIYGAGEVTYSKKALRQLKFIAQLGIGHYPVCITKTQYSFSTDAKAYGPTDGFTMEIDDIGINNGAEILVAVTGNIMRMPGLPKDPQANHIDIRDGKITGLS